MRLAGYALLCCAAVAAASATTLPVDSRHSHASFSLRAFWFKHIVGHFDGIYGAVTVAADGDVRVDAWIDVSRVRMDNPRDREQLLSPAFFDHQRYPRIHFRSAPLGTATLQNGGPVPGWLTVRGVTRAVHFTLLPSHCLHLGDGRCVLRLQGNIQRSDFGMRAHRLTLSDQVQLSLTVALSGTRPP